MNTKILKEIIQKKLSREDFAVLTNLSTGKSEIFDSKQLLSKEFNNYENEIKNYYNLNKNGIIDGTEVFILNYIQPIEVIIIGAVHIAQYLIDLLKNFNYVVTIIDPRKYFTTEQRFQKVKIINEWPQNALETMKTNKNFALITLTHDPKIDDPALNYALKNNFFYIGALGSKKTHENRCKRLKEAGFSEKEIRSVHGPIGIKFGGKSTPEIALSIVAQLVSETNKLLLNSKN